MICGLLMQETMKLKVLIMYRYLPNLQNTDN